MLEQRTINKSQIQSLSGLEQRTLQGQLKIFLLSCRVEELSPATIQNYNRKVGVFVRFCLENGVTIPSGVTTSLIQLFLVQRQETCQRIAVHNYYRAVRRFLAWMEQEGVIKKSPMSSIRMRKPADRIIQPFKPEHIRDLLLLCDETKFLGARNKAIILVFLDTGLRLSELANIQLRNIGFESETIKVMGKGAKERVVRIGKKTQKALLRYLLMRDDGLSCLWVSEERRPLTHWGIQLMIRKLGKRAGFTNVRCSPHTFRHTSATQSLRNGAGLEEVKSLLGHSTLYMTMRYAATISSEDAVISHRKFSPVDRLFQK